MPRKKTDDFMQLNKLELEVAVLLTAKQAIDGMVNYSMLDLNTDTNDVTIRPMTSENGELFNIRLADFIGTIGAPFPAGTSLLGALRIVCEDPQLNFDNSVHLLAEPVKTMIDWLAHDAEVTEVWLATIEKELTLRMPRSEFIDVCGTIAKHNVFRLEVVARKIHEILLRSDPTTKSQEAYLAIEDFFTWFHEDIFRYHMTKLSELLNDIRWGIFLYLRPEFSRAYTVDHERSAIMHANMYIYDVPQAITSQLGIHYYWELMNGVRSQPYVPKFKASKWLQGRY